jgi:hypothetical protein
MKKKVKHHHINSGGFMTRNATRVVMLLVATLLAGALPLMAGAVQNLSMGYDVSQGTYAPISGGTVQASGSTIQGFGAAVSMGFSVTWNGTTYSDAWVTGDGFIVLGTSSGGVDVISAWSNRLSGGTTAQLRTETLGTTGQRTFVVQWSNVTRAPAGSSNDNLNFQIRVRENGGIIDIVYGSMSVGGAMGARVGAFKTSVSGINLVARRHMSDWLRPMSTSNFNMESVARPNFVPSSGLTYTFRPLFAVDASIVSLNSPSGVFSAGTPQTIKVVVRNWGLNKLDSVMIRWSINGVAQTPVNFYPQPALNTHETMVVQLGTRTFPANSLNMIQAWTTLPNGSTDGNPGNDQLMTYVAPMVEGRLNVALGGANNTFPSFQDCIRHLTVSGISGNVNVYVYEGQYDEQIIIPAIAGAGSNGTITFMAAPGEEPIVTWGPANRPLGNWGGYEWDYTQVYLGPGAVAGFKGIEFRLPTSHRWGGHIVTDQPSSFSAESCRFNGPTNHTTVTTREWSVNAMGGSVNLMNNTFARMMMGINVSNSMSSAMISGNLVENVSEGIRVTSYNMNVMGNTVKSEISSNNNYGLRVDGAGTVANNKYNAVDAGRDGSLTEGIVANSWGLFNSPVNGLFIYNNMVAVDGFSTVRGISVNASTYAGAATRVYHNTVNLKGWVIIGGAFSSAGVFNGSTNINVLNNIFHNAGNTNDGGYAVDWVNTASTKGLVDFNDIYTSGTNVGRWNGTNIARNAGTNPLGTWRSTTGVDLNSSSVAVAFVGGEDLHITAIDNKLFGTSTIMGQVSKDIDGENRVVPYMGADEVRPTVAIIQHPESRYACLGESFQLICIADVTPGATVTYQWFKDGVELVGRTGAILNFGNTGYASSGVYTCVIKASDGFTTITVTSNAAAIIVVRPTNITKQPQSQPVAPGGTVILDVDAEAIGAPTNFVASYQWKKRYWDPTSVSYVDSNIVDNTRITGSNSTRLTIRDIMSVDTLDQYVCEVTGYCGNATSKPAKLFMPVVAASTNTPIACEGGSISLECAVLPAVVPGSTTEFQWYFNGNMLSDGANVSGSMAKALSISNVTSANAGTYHCVVSYSGAGVGLTSNTVDVTVGTAPTITTEPVGDTVCEGDMITLTAAAQGSGLSYHWMKGTTLIPGATSATYEIASAAAADAGSYSVQVTNVCGQVTSTNVDVVVNVAPSITTQPTDVAVFDGDEIKFTVVSSGSDPKTYQWYKGTAAIAGATSATFTIDSATGDDAGNYYCIVTNDCGADTSQSAVAGVTVGVAGDELPSGFMLGAAMPNPTMDVVSFRYTIPSTQNVRMLLTDAMGRQLAVLVDGMIDAGTHTIEVSAQSLGLAQGVYTYTFEANGAIAARQFVVVR